MVNVVSNDREILRERTSEMINNSPNCQMRFTVEIVNGGFILSYSSASLVKATEVFVSAPKLKKKINELLESHKTTE